MLREVRMGNLVGKHREDCCREYGDSYLKNLQACDFSPYGGEGPVQLQQRVREFLQMMEQSPYENVAVFGHSIYIGTVLDVVNGAGLKKGAFPCDFGSVSVFEFRDGCWRVNAWSCTELSR
jgi:broad specificity phosphatase PhoE